MNEGQADKNGSDEKNLTQLLEPGKLKNEKERCIIVNESFRF